MENFVLKLRENGESARTEVGGTAEMWGLAEERGVSGSARPLSFDELYSDAIARSKRVDLAIRLTHDLSQRLHDALVFTRRGELFQADDELTAAVVRLLELFCLRDAMTLGFGTVVNGLYHCLRNRSGEPFSEKQLLAVTHAIDQLRKGPFINVDLADEVLERIESTGLSADPTSLDQVSEDLQRLL